MSGLRLGQKICNIYITLTCSINIFPQNSIITSMYFLKERKPSVILNGEMVFYFFKYIIFFYNFEAMLLYFVKATSKFSKGLISSQCYYERKFTTLHSHSSLKIAQVFTVTIIYDIQYRSFFKGKNSSQVKNQFEIHSLSSVRSLKFMCYLSSKEDLRAFENIGKT